MDSGHNRRTEELSTILREMMKDFKEIREMVLDLTFQISYQTADIVEDA